MNDPFDAVDRLLELLDEIIRHGRITPEALRELQRVVPEARRFADEDTSELLASIPIKPERLQRLEALLGAVNGLPVGPERVAAAAEDRALLEWFVEQRDHLRRSWDA